MERFKQEMTISPDEIEELERNTRAQSDNPSLEPRLYVPDVVSQLWRKIGGKAWKDLARDTVAP